MTYIMFLLRTSLNCCVNVSYAVLQAGDILFIHPAVEPDGGVKIICNLIGITSCSASP